MSAIKERPIIFSGPMVRALLAGKTQTRRLVKPQPIRQHHIGYVRDRHSFCVLTNHASCVQAIKCPYGMVGDRLWVRETFLELDHDHWHVPGKPKDWIEPYSGRGRRNACAYRADCTSSDSDRCRIELGYHRWTSAIHMPRWASRLTLELIDIRCQRLHDISEADAEAEGCTHRDCGASDCGAGPSFRQLWENINGQKSWDGNPWVWALTFKREGSRDA